MSKFDQFFNKPAASFDKKNSFILKTESEAKAKAKYDYKEEAFPDLILSNKSSTKTVPATKKYSDITATVIEVNTKKVEDIRVPPGWTQFSRSKGKSKLLFDVMYGEKNQRQLEQDLEDDPLYVHNQMITALADNLLNYKMQYDSIHGEGEYDQAHYSEPIYPEDEAE